MELKTKRLCVAKLSHSLLQSHLQLKNDYSKTSDRGPHEKGQCILQSLQGTLVKVLNIYSPYSSIHVQPPKRGQPLYKLVQRTNQVNLYHCPLVWRFHCISFQLPNKIIHQGSPCRPVMTVSSENLSTFNILQYLPRISCHTFQGIPQAYRNLITSPRLRLNV